MTCPHCGAANTEGSARCSGCQRDLSEFGLTMERTDRGTEATSSPAPGSRAPRSRSGSFDLDADLSQRYHIVRQLGEGGMGEVYLAHDRELNRDVALKVIRAELAQHPQIMERFRREIQLSSKVTHKHVLRVFDLGEAAGVKFLTMEYIDGQDLASMLRREGKLSIPKAVEIFRQLCEGLAAAHDEGVIHRDLKPQNVLIDNNGRVAIADFGLAKSFEQVSLTEAGKVIGTPHYMSPEQVKGIHLDRRSDIYSLGIILFEMLTGRLPFTGSSPFEVMMQRVNKPSPLASDHNPQIPPYLMKILQRCLERERDLRYQTVGEILHDLGTQTFHSSLGYRVRKNRWISYAVAGVCVVALIAGVVVAVRHRSSSAVQTSSTHKPVSVLIADLDNQTGDAVFDGTLEPILTLAMEGASFITSYNRAQAHKAAAQIQPDTTAMGERLARLVAVREGLNVVVAGTVAHGDSYKLTLHAVDAVTGKQIESSEVTADTKEQMLTAVGRAAADLRKALGDTTPASTQLVAAETFTAASLEAAHEYAVGQDLFWRGKFEDATPHYEQAVKLDPSLGRAYAGLAASYANLGRKSDATAYYKLALTHLDRMTDREKFRTRSGYYLLTRNPQSAIDELNALVRQYPADTAGLNNLALAYFYNRDMTRALEEGRKPVAIYPKNTMHRNNVALYAMYAGDFKTAEEEARAVLQLNPSYAKAYVALALSQLAQGRPDDAAETYRRLEKVSPRGASMAAAGLTDVALYEGRFDDAAAAVAPAAEVDRTNKSVDSAAQKLATLAETELARGKQSAAIGAAESALLTAGESKEENVFFPVARVFAATGKPGRANDLAARLGSMIEPDPQLYGKLIEGEVKLGAGNAREALASFSQAQKLADSWLGRFDLGRAYLALGAYAEASSQFDACLKRRGEATAVFLDDVPSYHYFPPLHYYIGRAREGLGSPTASESYKTFLAMHGKATNDPLVIDAQKRLAAMK